jgi:Protein of unknown function (DUF4054)
MPYPFDNSLSAYTGAANVVYGTNPAYTSTNFLEMYPKFHTIVPDGVLTTYVTLASACLVQARYQELWPIVMGLFIAHFCTLYLDTDPCPTATAAQAAALGAAKGILTASSVGDVSASYQPIEGLDGWAAWTLTKYGQLFVTFAKLVGSGSMYIH